MKEKLLKEIEEIQNTLEVLPKNNMKQKEKYQEYIDDNIRKYLEQFNAVKSEIDTRYDIIKSSYSTELVPEIEPLNLELVRILDKRITSLEKMNLNYYFYELSHFYDNDLDKINNVILEILEAFNKVGIKLTANDFNYSELVYDYMNTLLNDHSNIKQKFETIFWTNHDIINHIAANFKYLYYKNEKKIDKFYEDNYKQYNYDQYLNNYIVALDKNEKEKSRNKKYVLDLLLNKKVIAQALEPKNLKTTIDTFLPREDGSNYEYLLKIRKSLIEYKRYLDFEYIITGFKTIFPNKESFKDQFENKLKEVSKKEDELFKFNKKINSKSIFRPKGNKLDTIIYTRNTTLTEILNLYKELDELEIGESIYKNVTPDSSYLEVLSLMLHNFHYLVKLIKEQYEDVEINVIRQCIDRLSEFVYQTNISLISNINIAEDKNIAQIISDRYKISNIKLEEADLDKEKIDKTLEKINEIIASYDIKSVGIKLDEVEFLMKVDAL